MGIFEKSIPKYVINPVDQNLQAAPQEYVVDDIFDPIFNANVRNAMRQKYGEGLYGIAGGYSDLLQNAWAGDQGLFGKGMGILSTFGRSMEKADDIALGLLTETVEGLSGQGFDNPLHNIFTEDQDYSGRRFLASTANIFRGLAGGTTISERDLDPIWNVPAMGIDLATDVGILGGGLARKFAPNAKDFTSKQLFQNLGKSDIKTTVGEVGQLMSNYDDLMAKVAIDVTAPGLRPAFKALSNKLAQYIATNAPQAFVDFEILRQNPDNFKAAKEYYDNEPMAQMLDNVIKITDDLPKEVPESTIPDFSDAPDIQVDVPKSMYEAAELAGDTAALEHYNFIRSAIESGDYSAVDQAIRDYSEQLGTKITESYSTYGKKFAASLNGLIERLQAEGIPLNFVGISQVSDELPTQSLDEVRQIVKGVLGDDWTKRDVKMPELNADELEFVNRLIAISKDEDLTKAEIDAFKAEGLTTKELLWLISPEAWDDVRRKRSAELVKENPELASRAYSKLKHRGINVWESEGTSAVSKKTQSLSGASLTGVEREAIAELENLKAHLTRFVKENPSSSPSDVQKIYKRLYTKVRKKYPESVWASITSKDTILTRFENLRPKRSINTVAGANPTYVDEVLEKLDSDDALRYALQNKEWTTNEAVNNAIEAALGDPKYSQSLWYAHANPKFRLSPSRMTKMDMFGQWGTSLAYTRLEAARFLLRDPNKPRFKSKDELLKYLSTSKMEEAIREYFPKYASKDLDDIRKAIADVYYPEENLTVRGYTTSLDVLSRLLDDSRMRGPDYKLLSSAPDESLFLEDLYRAFDEIEEYPDAYGRKAKHFGIDQLYLQPLRDETPSSKGARRTAETPMYRRRETVYDDLSGTASVERPVLITGGDKVKGLRDDETLGLTSYAKSILSQVSKYIKTDEDMFRILGDFLNYVQVQPALTVGKLDEARRYLSNVTGIPESKITRDMLEAHVFKDRLMPSEATLKAVDTFRKEVLGPAHAYLVTYGSYFKYPPKGASESRKKLFNEIRARLGYDVNDYYLKKYNITPDPNGYANRLMLESLIQSVDGKKQIKKLDSITDDDILRFEDAAMKARLSKKLPDPKAELKNNIGEIFERVRQEKITTESADEAAKAIKKAIVEAPVEDVAKQAYVPLSSSSQKADTVLAEIAGDMKAFLDNGGSDEAGKTVFGEEKWSWFKQIHDSLNVSNRNAFRDQRATLRIERNAEVGRRIAKYESRLTLTGKENTFKQFNILRQKELGDVVKGSDFWEEFRRAGKFEVPYLKNSKQLPKTVAALEYNADLINKAAKKDIVEVVVSDYGTHGVKQVTMQFKGDIKTIKYIKNALTELNSAKYQDVVFSPPTKLTASERSFMDSADSRELSELMDSVQNIVSDQAQYLGFKFDTSRPYVRHAMVRSPEAERWISDKFYKNMPSSDYDDLTNLISNFDEYRKTDKGSFGTTLQTRRFRGDYWLFDDPTHTVFDYSPTNIYKSAVADGIFANLKFQDTVDLFFSNDFKINGWFNSVDDLKKVLYATDDKGKLSGNLVNSELVACKFDENGKIVGLIKYDKMSNEGLAKALANKDTILVPANAVSYLDASLRKDVQMSNKFWTFINKHFTIPFKFGLLSNPGFLLGNISDSMLKLSTTMSEKYGTTFAEEAVKTAECVNAAGHLKNEYLNAFDVWRKVSLDYGIKLSPEALVPDIVAMSPKYKEDFLKWLDDSLEVPFTYQNDAGIFITEMRHVPCDLPKETIDNASIWTMLQGVQMSSNKLREYAELAEISPHSRFDVATNLFDRVTKGSGKYDPKDIRTHGVFMNNVYMSTLSKMSSGYEDVIRTASILDDLRHGQYSKEDFAKYARGSKGTEDSIKYRVRLDEAVNTMYNAQFDYSRQSDFVSKLGKTVPFPIFFLKNLHYWMELFIKNPQYVDNAIDVQESLWEGYNDEDDKFMTEAKGRGAIPVGDSYSLPKWFKGIYKPSPLQSMFGAFSLLNDPAEDLSYRVNPLIGGAKVAAAQVLPDSDLTTLLKGDSDSVKYRPYSTYMYERNIKVNDPKFNALEYTVHRANPFERPLNTYLRLPEKIESGEAQMSDVLPSVFQPMF